MRSIIVLLAPCLLLSSCCAFSPDDADCRLREKYANRLSLIEQELQREILLNMKEDIECLQDEIAMMEFSLRNPGIHIRCRLRPVYASWGQFKGWRLLYEAAGLTGKDNSKMTEEQREQILSDVYSKIFPGKKYEFSPINPKYLEP